MFGSFNESGFDDTHCFDRQGRFGPYGYTEDSTDLNGRPIDEEEAVDWNGVNWGDLQDQCVERNVDLFGLLDNQTHVSPFKLPDASSSTGKHSRREALRQRSTARDSKGQLSRKAVLVRCKDSKKYNTEVLHNLRSMVTELSLHTGGEYAVYLLVEVADQSREIHKSESAYQQALTEYIPKEFRAMTFLFNQQLLEAWYPKIDADGGQSLHSNQPVQLFSLFNPQFSHVWDVAIETRYTGNWYSFLSHSMDWARRQPRRLQWERAAKFYIPSYHGSYQNFSEGIVADNPRGGVWGPVPNDAVRVARGPQPPTITALEDTEFTWGVGEDADDIVPSVLADTADTPIFEHNRVQGFHSGSPRRALMVSPVSCLSRTLLHAMHDAQATDGLDMRPELFAHTLALAHGLKVAALPLPMYYDGGGSGSSSSAFADPTAVNALFNDPTRRFLRDEDNKDSLPTKSSTTFWWKLKRDQAAPRLYRKWYGVDADGKRVDVSRGGRLCLPGMLLHPVPDVLPV